MAICLSPEKDYRVTLLLTGVRRNYSWGFFSFVRTVSGGICFVISFWHSSMIQCFFFFVLFFFFVFCFFVGWGGVEAVFRDVCPSCEPPHLRFVIRFTTLSVH